MSFNNYVYKLAAILTLTARHLLSIVMSLLWGGSGGVAEVAMNYLYSAGKLIKPTVRQAKLIICVQTPRRAN